MKRDLKDTKVVFEQKALEGIKQEIYLLHLTHGFVRPATLKDILRENLLEISWEKVKEILKEQDFVFDRGFSVWIKKESLKC